MFKIKNVNVNYFSERFLGYLGDILDRVRTGDVEDFLKGKFALRAALFKNNWFIEFFTVKMKHTFRMGKSRTKSPAKEKENTRAPNKKDDILINRTGTMVLLIFTSFF